MASLMCLKDLLNIIPNCCGIEKIVSRETHNLKVGGANPPPATNYLGEFPYGGL